MLIISTLTIILSLVTLAISAKYFLDSSIVIARKLGLSSLVVGTIIVGFATGLPTILVSVFLLINNTANAEIAIGNIIGTNYVNLGLALGIAAFLTTITTKFNTFEKEIPLYLAMSGLLASFASDGYIDFKEGALTLAVLSAIQVIIYQYAKREKQNGIITTDLSRKSVIRNLVIMVVVMIIMPIASVALTMITPTFIKESGLNAYIVGLTVVGIGTSMPTIVACIQAAKKNEIEIVLGNVFGGNIINIGMGVSVLALIHKIPISKEANEDIVFTQIYDIIILLLILIEMKLLGGNKALSRVSGIIIVSIYCVYILSKICL